MAKGVEVEGLVETLAAFKALDADLRAEANSELRTAARQAAGVLVGQLQLAAAGSGVPVAPRVAGSIKVKNDRIPAVQIGGSKRVGRRGAPASALLWGSEHGGHNFAAAAGGSYWIQPTVQAFQRDEAVTIYKRAIVDLQKRHGLI